jgi:hypothetical protein
MKITEANKILDMAEGLDWGNPLYKVQITRALLTVKLNNRRLRERLANYGIYEVNEAGDVITSEQTPDMSFEEAATEYPEISGLIKQIEDKTKSDDERLSLYFDVTEAIRASAKTPEIQNYHAMINGDIEDIDYLLNESRKFEATKANMSETERAVFIERLYWKTEISKLSRNYENIIFKPEKRKVAALNSLSYFLDEAAFKIVAPTSEPPKFSKNSRRRR